MRHRREPIGPQLPDRGDRVGVAEEAVVVERDLGPAGRVDDPVRGLERDAVGVVEVDRADEAVVDDVGDLAVGGLQPGPQVEQGLLVDEVERQVVELRGAGVGDPGRLGEAVDLDALVLEERDRVARADLEEVVAERVRADGRHEPGAEHADVEADGRVHVGAHQREVVDAPPAGLACCSAMGTSVASTGAPTVPTAVPSAITRPPRRRSLLPGACRELGLGDVVLDRLPQGHRHRRAHLLGQVPEQPRGAGQEREAADDPPVEAEVGERGAGRAGRR